MHTHLKLPKGSSAGNFATTQTYSKLQANCPQTIVLYGCSLTEHGAWANAFKEWFHQAYPGVAKVLNTAGSGQNSTWALENLQKRVLDHKPNLVFIEFAYNDAHLKFELTPQQAEHNLETILQRLKHQAPELDIVIQTMNVGWDAPNGNRSASVRPQLSDYYAVYQQVARRHGLQLINHRTTWETLKADKPATFQMKVPDGSHPTAEASLEITWPAIQSWLEASPNESKHTA